MVLRRFTGSRRALVLLGFPVAIAVLSPGAASQPQPTAEASISEGAASVYGLPLPNRIGPFVRADAIDNEERHRGMGQTIPYLLSDRSAAQGRPITTTVYIYPATPMPEPANGRDHALRAEAQSALEEVRAATDLGVYAASRYEGHSWLDIGGAARFIVVEVVTRRAHDGAADERGAIALAWVNGRFLKIRITAPSQDEARLHTIGFAGTLARAFGMSGDMGAGR